MALFGDSGQGDSPQTRGCGPIVASPGETRSVFLLSGALTFVTWRRASKGTLPSVEENLENRSGR